jgi:hypothetical protein
MHTRDATDEDADAVAALADGDVDAERLIRDRSVRVAERDGDGGDADGDPDLAGFVAFDAWRGTVHVTRFGGNLDAVRALLDAPREFARREGVPLEVVVPEGEDAARETLDAEGFEHVGAGPMFAGERTRRYRWQSEENGDSE